MRLTIPRLLLLVALAAFFLPSVSSAELQFCSDQYCASVPPDHPCICAHCPWASAVECGLRWTCPFEENFAATDSEESLTVLDPTSAEEAAKLEGSSPDLEEEPESSKVSQPLQTEEEEAT